MISTDSGSKIPPLQPQPFEVMRARFRQALRRTFQYGPKGDQWPPKGPWEYPEQRFDFEDGMRMMVSRDAYGDRVELHLSASIIPGSELWQQCENRDGFGAVSRVMFKILVEDRYRELSGDVEHLPFNGFTNRAKGFKGVPHWRRPE